MLENEKNNGRVSCFRRLRIVLVIVTILAIWLLLLFAFAGNLFELICYVYDVKMKWHETLVK